jgi:ribosome biogenesis GTPase
MQSDATLTQYGWNDQFAGQFAEYAEGGLLPGRIVFEDNLGYRVITERGQLDASAAGRLRYEARSREELPAVGDWVALKIRDGASRAVVHAVLPRYSRFARKVAGSRTEGQIVGANIDTVFLVSSLNQDFSVRRLERYLALAWESGARPVIVLSKADLCENPAEKITQAERVAAGVPVHAVSVRSGAGLDALSLYLCEGETVALLGSSGVGKSTLLNHFLGYSRQRVREVRQSDDRGMHATRRRELILLPQGGLFLDTPGMRELQLWEGADGVQTTFEDIEALAADCRFSNCRHESEPHCAVRAALEQGHLDARRFESYVKLQAELEHFRVRYNDLERRNVKRKWKQLSRIAKERSHSKREGPGKGS